MFNVSLMEVQKIYKLEHLLGISAQFAVSYAQFVAFHLCAACGGVIRILLALSRNPFNLVAGDFFVEIGRIFKNCNYLLCAHAN